MINKSTSIVITAHAKERIIERFDDLLPAYGSKREFNSVVETIIRNGSHLEDWKRVPFYVNMINTKRGLGTEFIQNGKMMFICTLNSNTDTLVVVTAVKRMLYYPVPGTIAVGSAGGAKYLDEARYLASLETEAYTAYQEKYGGTPKEIWQHRSIVKEDGKLSTSSLEDKMATIDQRLGNVSSESVQEAEELYDQLHSIMRKLGKLTKQHVIDKYLHLISLVESAIMRTESEGNDSSKFYKKLRRYQNEINSKGLTK